MKMKDEKTNDTIRLFDQVSAIYDSKCDTKSNSCSQEPK